MKPENNKPEKMKTVTKALDIIELFLNRSGELSVSEIAKMSGQNISTVHGILGVLAKRGYIRQIYNRGKYSLGPKFLSFNKAVEQVKSIEEIAHPFMEDLVKEADETVAVAIQNKNEALFVGMVSSGQALRVFSDQSSRIPLYCSSLGKIFLAQLSDEAIERYWREVEIIPLTPKTIVDVNEIKKQCQGCRKEGVSYDYQEYNLGIASVAAPITDASGKVVAAIAVLGPTVRMKKDKVNKITFILKYYASKISAVMANQKEQPF